MLPIHITFLFGLVASQFPNQGLSPLAVEVQKCGVLKTGGTSREFPSSTFFKVATRKFAYLILLLDHTCLKCRRWGCPSLCRILDWKFTLLTILKSLIHYVPTSNIAVRSLMPFCFSPLHNLFYFSTVFQDSTSIIRLMQK